MKKLILLFILIMPVIVKAGTVGQYIIFTSSFPTIARNNMFEYAVDKSKDIGQPAQRVWWKSQVSTDTHKSGIVKTSYRDNTPVIDNETKEIWMEVCISVENFHPIENFISQGKILKVGYYSFNRKEGYNRDRTSPGNIYDAADRRNEWDARHRVVYEVEISTP